jgi:hypothetical protein
MKLTDEQSKQVASWISEGLNLSQIQKKINEDLGIPMTYMDVRFLVDDLDLDLQCDPVVSEEDAKNEANKQEEQAGVILDVDVVTRPGTLVSGTVTFTDGKTCEWQLDQMGRLGLVPAEQGYKPDPEDLQDFQIKLQEELQKKGFG